MSATKLLFYGDSGNGKTSILASACEWLMRTAPGKKAVCYSADDTEVLEPYVERGVLEIEDIGGVDHPFEVIPRACMGWRRDAKGKWRPPLPGEFDAFPVHMYEGLHFFGELFLERLAEEMGNEKRIGPGTRPGEDGISFKDGETGVGGNTMTHYNVAQKELRTCVKHKCTLLKGLCLWTTHEVKTSEDNKPIFAPELVGKKASKDVQSWFSSTYHAHTVKQKKGDGVDYRLYFKEHYDGNIGNIPYKALQRVPLLLLDPARRAQAESEWDKLIPEYLDWTNDSMIFSKVMAIRSQMREVVNNILKGGA